MEAVVAELVTMPDQPGLEGKLSWTLTTDEGQRVLIIYDGFHVASLQRSNGILYVTTKDERGRLRHEDVAASDSGSAGAVARMLVREGAAMAVAVIAAEVIDS